MTRFLRLFRQYRDLELLQTQAESSRIRADDECRVWRCRADLAEADRDKARNELQSALKAVANFQAIMAGAPLVPFPEEYKPIAVTAPDPSPGPPAGPRTLRDVQRLKVMESRKAAFDRMQAARAAEEAS